MTIAQSNSLRKACQNCTKCKRRCIIELPRCQRCRQRNIECIYDLEPLIPSAKSAVIVDRRHRNSRNSALPKSTKSSNDAASTTNGFLYFISSLYMSERKQAFCETLTSQMPASTPIPVTFDPDDTCYLVGQLQCIPDLVRNRKASPFIHPELYISTPHGYLDTVFHDDNFLRNQLSVLFALDVQHVPLVDLLASIQSLMLFFFRYIFNHSRPWPAAEPFLDLLARWRAILWSSSVRRMPPDLTPWHSWLLSESIRRTMLMAYLLNGTFSAWKNGYCSHELFVEALPFCARGELWRAATAQEWSALIR